MPEESVAYRLRLQRRRNVFLMILNCHSCEVEHHPSSTTSRRLIPDTVQHTGH